jgi:D-inositol-3-phosphate glycosyltransferase
MHLARQSDKIFANSRTEEAYIESLYGARKDAIIILSPGVNVELFHPYDKVTAKKEVGAPLEKKMILFVGRPEPLKGIDTLMYAVKILIEKDPLLSLSLWIVGGIVGKNIDTWSKELKKLESLRRTLSISSNVHFIGRKSQEELPSFYNAADIVVLPSHYESFGITALEAMACGTPVVTTDVTGVADLFDKKHSPLITSAHNPIRLAQKLHNLLTDKKMYEKSSKEVFEKVQDLSWSKIADKYISVVNKCTTRSVL